MRRLIWLLLVASCFGQMNISFPSPQTGLAAAAPHPKQKFISRVLTGTLTNRFFLINGHNATAATGEFVEPILLAGNIRKLYVRFDSDPDSGSSSNGYTVTVRKGTSDTAAACTVLSSTANFECSYTGADVHFAATDKIDYKITANGSPANSPALSTIVEFEPDAHDGSTVLSAGSSTNAASTDGLFFTLIGPAVASSTEVNNVVVVPMNGTILLHGDNLTVASASGTRTYTLRCIGSSAGSCGGNGAGSFDLGTPIVYAAGENGAKTRVENISILQGDRLSVRQNVTGSITASTLGFGIVFKPTTSGEFMLASSMSSTGMSNSASTFITMSGNTAILNATEATVQEIATADFSLKGFTACGAITPGSGKTFTLTLQENGNPAGTTYSTQLTNSAFCPVTSASTSFPITANYDLYDTLSVPSGTPSAIRVAISYIGYIAP